MNKNYIEFLTLKECTRIIPGISYYDIRQLIAQGRLPAERAGGKPNGKLLVRKSDLLACFKIDE